MVEKFQKRYACLAIAVLAVSLQATGQQAPITMPATFLDRLYINGTFGGGLMPQKYINDSSTHTITSFSGLEWSGGIGVQLTRHFFIEGDYTRGSVKGKVTLPKAVSEFQNSVTQDPFVAQDPGLSSAVQQTVAQIPAPHADLSLHMRSEVPAILGGFKFNVFSKLPLAFAGGITKTSVDYLTLAKDGVPNGLSINENGSLSVTTGGLYDKGTQSRWNGTARASIPFRIKNGFEIAPQYQYLTGRHYLQVGLNIYLFAIGKHVAY